MGTAPDSLTLNRAAEPPDLTTLSANAAGKHRREWSMGREFIVTPMTTIVPGVLAGSQGALFYPPEQISRNVRDWDGMPLTCYHPIDPLGRHVSARDEGVIDRQGIGQVRDSVYNDKLQHEAWFDVERVRHVDGTLLRDKPHAQILPRLLRNEPIELSTGLYTQNVPAAPGAHHNGRPYDFVAEDYRPDHVAVLPDQVGACSLRDGCGVLVNEATSGELVQNVSADPLAVPTPDAIPSATASTPKPILKTKAPKKEPKERKAATAGSAEAISRMNEYKRDTTGAYGGGSAAPTQNSNPEGHNQYTGAIGKQVAEHFGHLIKSGDDQRAYVHKVDSEDKLIHVQPVQAGGVDKDSVQRGHNNVKMTQEAADNFERANPDWSVIVRDPKATHNRGPIMPIQNLSAEDLGFDEDELEEMAEARDMDVDELKEMLGITENLRPVAAGDFVANDDDEDDEGDEEDDADEDDDEDDSEMEPDDGDDEDEDEDEDDSELEPDDDDEEDDDDEYTPKNARSTNNADQPKHAVTGRFLGKDAGGAAAGSHSVASKGDFSDDSSKGTQRGDTEDPALYEEASKRGISVDELKAQMGGGGKKSATKNRRTRNAAQAKDADAPARQVGNPGSKNFTGTDVDPLRRGKPAKVPNYAGPDAGLSGGDDDDEDDADVPGRNRAAKKRTKVRNSMDAPCPAHDASKQAAGASVMAEHPKARDHALAAMDASGDDDHDGAADSHDRAARQHDRAAVASRRDEDESGAADHEQAAMLHRRAAAMHQVTQNTNNRRRNVTTRNENPGPYSPGQFAMMDEKAGDASERAGNASKAADKKGTAEAHQHAATRHKEASYAQATAGNHGAAKEHAAKAKEHRGKAKELSNNSYSGGSYVDRSKTIGFITANCDCWRKETLNRLSTEELDAVKENLIVANSARAGFKLGSENYVYNAQGKLVKNDGGPASADGGPSGKSIQAGGEEDDDETTDDTFPSRRGKGLEGGGKVKTMNQFLATAPPEVQTVLRNAIRRNNQDRAKLIERLTENASSSEHRQRLIAGYSKFSDDELRDAVATIPTANSYQAQVEIPPEMNFLGAAGGPMVDNAAEDQTDVLPLPTMNWGELSTELAHERHQRVS